VALVSGQVTPEIAIDGSLQYDAAQNRTAQFDLAGRYNPQPGRVLNAAYRYTRDQIKQVDLSGQWPLGAGLTVVGRWNWSLSDSKLIEGVAGFEYNAGCWEIRAVAHRFITATQQVSTSFQVQLELSGLSRIGINPLETLKQNISGYRRSQFPISAAPLRPPRPRRGPPPSRSRRPPPVGRTRLTAPAIAPVDRIVAIVNDRHHAERARRAHAPRDRAAAARGGSCRRPTPSSSRS
jgi:hypothetical protein